MMEVAVIILVLIGMTAWLDKILGDDDDIRNCIATASVCSDEQCCVESLDRKDFTCRSLGRENEDCFTYQYDIDEPDYFVSRCPCMEGLTCVSNGDLPDYTDPKSDGEPDGTCRSDSYLLEDDPSENLHLIENGTKSVLQSDKNEAGKYLDLEKSAEEVKPQEETTEIKNLQLEELEKEKNSQIEMKAEMEKKSQFSSGEIIKENKCDLSSLQELISLLPLD